MFSRIGFVCVCVLVCVADARKRGYSGFAASSFDEENRTFWDEESGKPTGTCEDPKALGLSDTWSYNWGHVPYYHHLCDVHHPTAEYAPMMTGLGVAATILKAGWEQKNTLGMWKNSSSKYLLGYNEPDYGNGKNHPSMCSPADAAKDWVAVQKVPNSPFASNVS
jgi:hypothetical protein